MLRIGCYSSKTLQNAYKNYFQGWGNAPQNGGVWQAVDVMVAYFSSFGRSMKEKGLDLAVGGKIRQEQEWMDSGNKQQRNECLLPGFFWMQRRL